MRAQLQSPYSMILRPMTATGLVMFALLFHLLFFSVSLAQQKQIPGSVIFTTLGRSHYAFDIFTLPLPAPSILQQHPSLSHHDELRLTDGLSVNFNGHFPTQTLIPSTAPHTHHVIYVSERNGSSTLYYDALYSNPAPTATRFRSALQIPARIQLPLLDSGHVLSMKDKPTLSAHNLIYVSTHQDPGQPRTSWAAVYSTHLRTGLTRRLTPPGIADFSPAVSPSGDWIAVASYGKSGWDGEVEELSTDIYIFLTRDGSKRAKVVEHGGWPTWADDSTLYFHRRSDDGWISVYRAVLPGGGRVSTDSVKVDRVTPAGLHSFTPAASADNHNFIAVATRRPGSDYRHIELFDLVRNEFVELTRHVSPETHHFNPFLSPDSSRVGYHKCTDDSNGRKSPQVFLENVQSPVPNLSIFRIDGSFPSFSPTGDRIAFSGFPGIYVVNSDGSNRRQVYPGLAFSTAWDPVRAGIVYTSAGPDFATEKTEVDIIALDVNEIDNLKITKLTTNGVNNAFPSVSPDGKRIVFRSAGSGHKNLYIMDAIKGEAEGLTRLTEGPWTDTMSSWSPNGEWIAFSSDRHEPGSGSFELYLIHPNGTGLRRLARSGSGGRVNHPAFSPDGERLTFTSDYSGISGEPISNPHHYQPYGEIFTINLDGSGLTRLTHNSYEDGTPTWAPYYLKPVDVDWALEARCDFEDCHWLNQMPSFTKLGN